MRVIGLTRDPTEVARYAAALPGWSLVAVPVTTMAPLGPEEAATFAASIMALPLGAVVACPSGRAADVLARAWPAGRPRGRGFAVGERTGEVLAAAGFAVTIASAADGLGLAASLRAALPAGTVVAWPRAEGGRRDGAAHARAGGLVVKELVAYRMRPMVWTLDKAAALRAELAALAVLVVFAPSQAQALAALWVGAEASRLPSLVAIGPTTATALGEAGLPVAAIALAPTPAAMARAVASVYPARHEFP